MKYLICLSLLSLLCPKAQAVSIGRINVPGYQPNYWGPTSVEVPAEAARLSKIYLPKNYDTKKSWPLILMLHGYTSNPFQADLLLGLSKRVTRRGFILVEPEGSALPFDDLAHNLHKGDKFWNATDFCCDFEKTGVNDVAFLTSLVEQVAKKYRVDRKRIYLYGHSNGGFMVNRLLCETEGLFAGAVVLAGSTYKNPALCRLKNPVPYLHAHAEDDPTVSFDESPEHAGGWPTVLQRVVANRCVGSGVLVAPLNYVFSIPGDDTTSITWSNCAENAEVVLWKIRRHSASYHAPHHPCSKSGPASWLSTFCLSTRSIDGWLFGRCQPGTFRRTDAARSFEWSGIPARALHWLPSNAILIRS